MFKKVNIKKKIIMGDLNRLEPIKAARRFIENYFPYCDGALLAGRVVRGEATKTSDLNIVIFDKTYDSSYRESVFVYDCPIEVFVILIWITLQVILNVLHHPWHV